MPPTLPPRLRPGDHIRVIAPSMSRALVLEHDHRALIQQRYDELGLNVSFGAHVDERDPLGSTGAAARAEDLHAAFADPDVQGVMTVIGGFNANETLPLIDWELIAQHPKVFCGFSDITVLQNAMLARAGLVTYSGPHWATFGMRDHLEDTLAWFQAAVFGSDPIELKPSVQWTDDEWFRNQDDRHPVANEGWWELQAGTAGGELVGGNLCTLNLLQGTPWMPELAGRLLLAEDDAAVTPGDFARDLTSLLQQPGAAGITGLVIGRFQRASGVTRKHLAHIVAAQPALAGKPVLANIDVGHTLPLATIPIGGEASLEVGATAGSGSGAPGRLVITRH